MRIRVLIIRTLIDPNQCTLHRCGLLPFIYSPDARSAETPTLSRVIP